MNGEIDIIQNNSLRKILSGTVQCGPTHTSLAMHVPTVEPITFNSVNSMNAKDCPDYECSSSGILSAGSDVTSEENNEFLRVEKVEGCVNESSCSRLTPSNSSQISPQLNSFVENTSNALSTPDCIGSSNPTPETPGSGRLFSVTPTCFPSELNEGKVHPCTPDRLEELNFVKKGSRTQQEDNIGFGDSKFAQQSLLAGSINTDSSSEAIVHIGSMSQMHQPQLSMDQRIPRLDQDFCNIQSCVNKFNTKSLQAYAAGDGEVAPDSEPLLSSSNVWNKSNCLAGSDDVLPFSYAMDALPPNISNNLSDTSFATGDLSGTTQNVLTAAVAAAAAKRAITGGHQGGKFCSSTRPAAWANGTSTTLSAASLGSTGASQWTVGNNGAKLGISSFNATNQPVSSTISSSNTSSTTWAQLLAQQQSQSKNGAQNLSAMLGAMNLGNNSSVSALPMRSSISAASGNNSTGFNISTVNKTGPSGLANIYSMFPKRPQHRMMAHWQQQQQHHPSFQQQSQGNRNPGVNNNIQQLGGNRIPNTSMDLANLGPTTGASGDSANLVSFSGGFASSSVLQSLANTVGQNSTMGQMGIGSVGDSFGPLATSGGVSLNENTSPLDTFKFGLDQQLMEVIKSFESSGIGPTSNSNANTNNSDGSGLVGGSFDDMMSNFADVDQQFSGMGCVNPISMLGHNTAATSPLGPAGLNGTNNHAPSLGNIGNCNAGSTFGPVGTNPYPVFTTIPAREEGYSRKVFVGGLPPDIDEEEITTAFRRFGPLIVDWPHKTESKAYFPPKGYCFLLFQDERSVQSLISACIVDEGKYYWCVSSPTMKDKPVQIRPWNLADSDFVMDGSQPLDPRKTIFVGGVPRPLRAIELALIMDRLYGGVCYAGIDTDPELKYPKGAGRVAFSNQQSYIAAISARFVQLQHNEIDKRVEVKPYVLDNQMCDECQGARCGGKFAPFFCANVTCLQYYCEQCWVQIHSRHGREYHKPLVKEGAERPRPALYRW
ncbi:Cytoplasmic polyadenylation element-binding protein 4 [Fasciola gigantica]|uniref:Cytoplasmic polyadenylation element-binding protein 4 n=1 Tax=Fasciola gigantica TaxID=46835 RepID=A0A504YLQ6_FASGI|nr:Cytoplasmic polyadenylation element-binding protein 4 [Fasciola gigantica]